jgi:hypothetical protein
MKHIKKSRICKIKTPSTNKMTLLVQTPNEEEL